MELGSSSNSFEMFSVIHLATILVLLCLILLLFLGRRFIRSHTDRLKFWERFAAISLFAMEVSYHLWMSMTGRWGAADSLPLELCSISLLAAIILLWTGDRRLVDFVVFAGIGGALQAVITPVLDMNFPHFRFFHFFYTHAGIILTGLYFVWVKNYRPTFRGVLKTMIAVNALLPIIMAANWLFDGNYMFLRMKPQNGSLLDFLGPYPWYILSLEAVAFIMFSLIWLLLRKRSSRKKIVS